ncbi:MAG: XRE family transcriptional regulator [Pseudonocardiaceae bacterium]
MTKKYRALQVELEARPDHNQRAAEAKATLGAQDDSYFRRLSELRHARHMTQVALAERLHMVQPSVSRLERQADLYVSTLRRYIEAIGGRLELHAVFPDLDAELRLDAFDGIDRDNPDVGHDSELREAL